MFHKDTPAKCFPRSSVNSQPASSGASCATNDSIPALTGGAQTCLRRLCSAGVTATMHIGELGHAAPGSGELGEDHVVVGVTECVLCRAPIAPGEQPATNSMTTVAVATAIT